jgi:hypothetical protein
MKPRWDTSRLVRQQKATETNPLSKLVSWILVAFLLGCIAGAFALGFSLVLNAK